MSKYSAGVDGVTFASHDCKLLGSFYRAEGETPRPTVVLLHGLPGVEKNLDIAYRLRDIGWNCLCFHFRGSWGSEGSYALGGLADDTRAAVEWTLAQPSVDTERLALIGGSVGGHTVLLYGATNLRIRAIVGVCPVIDPRTFTLGEAMAHEFAAMLSGVSGRELQDQWSAMRSVTESLPSLASRPVLLVTGDRDELFPPAHYTDFVAGLPGVQWARTTEGDHAFSTCRPWMVSTVTDWLVSTLGT